jgi:hypothetical protein
VRREVLLKVKVSDGNVGRRLEELLKLVVEDELTTVVGVLETVVDDVLVDELGHLRTGDELTLRKSKELAQLRCNFLLAVEPVVGGAGLGLLTVRILLGVLHLADELGESLDISAKGGNFSLDSFKRHYTFLSVLIFK